MVDRGTFLLVARLFAAIGGLGCEALAEKGRDRCADLGSATETDRNGIAARYRATYTRLDGSCGELEIPAMVTFDGPRTETFASFEVETNAVLNGCDMFFSQVVRARTSGQVQLEVDGPALVARDTDTISGEVSAKRFDADGSTSCAGAYDAQLERIR